jgi:two-component system chemotaxis response regulator CheB
VARDIIVIGASAGGVDALRQVASGLPSDLHAAVFVVIHLLPEADSMLPAILARAGPLPAKHPKDGEKIQPGIVYVAPPNLHLILLDGHVRLSHGPRQNRHRPSVDTLFRSAAYSYGPRVIGAVLTGSLADGAAGLRSIQGRGGATIVQDPDEAQFPGMPRAALMMGANECLPLAEIAPRMVRLTAEEGPRGVPAASKELEMEIKHDQGDLTVDLDSIGKPSYFTCPECHGTLWEIPEGAGMRYRCRVGHGYSAEGLIEHMDETLEDSLWAATRSLMENAHLKERVANRLIEKGNDDIGESLRMQAAQTRRHAETIRRLVSANDRPRS